MKISQDDVSKLVEKANQGDKVAQYDLGMLYEKGKGVKKDKREAERWLKCSALQNYMKAQEELAILQRSQNNPEYWHWFCCASINGSIMAENCINGHLDRASKNGHDAAVMLEAINLVVKYIKANGIEPTENREFLSKIDPNDKEGCYIATAVYGSYDNSQVVELRRFRDNFLLKREWGKQFVRLYYRYSPNLAKKLKNSIIINPIIRRTLDLFVKLIKYL